MAFGSDLAAVCVLASAAAGAAAAALVWTRRRGPSGTALAAMLAALTVWDVCYGAELLATDPSWRLALGDLKYVGIVALTPTWLSFILCWTGHGARVGRRLLLLLSVEPVALLLLLALPMTHDLVRHLPAGAADPLTAEVAVGPVFWVHLVYTDGLLVPATIAFVVSLVRRSRAYWLQAAALVVAAVLPWVASLLFTLSVGPFGTVDLTGPLFTLTGIGMVWGLWSQRLLRLNPRARSVLVDRMPDGVLVLDAYGHITDANPAARTAFADGRDGDPRLFGRRAADVLPAAVLAAGGAQVVLPVAGGSRTYEVSDISLPGRRSQPAGRLLVLRDVTARARLEAQLRELLADQARVADQLASSLRPAAPPEVPGMALAAQFRPAGGGREIGGDFYDVFPVDDEWAFALGDVSGKGAQAAATTAHARYTLRTLVLAGARPAAALEQLHALVRDQLGDETYLTVVHGRFRVVPQGVSVVLALGGHPEPLVMTAAGVVPAGRPGSAIGLFDDVDISETEVLLAPGDSLLLFTDGVSEARQGGALFGEAGLTDAAVRLTGRPAAEVADALLAEVLLRSGSEPVDDIALLVLQAGLPAGMPVPRPSSDPHARTA